MMISMMISMMIYSPMIETLFIIYII